MARFQALGAALVAIGVAGEFSINTKAGKLESDMRDKTRQLVAIAEGESASAKERASRADERAATNEREAAHLNKVAADERLEIITLEQRLLPRTVSPQQRDAFKENAKGLQQQ